MKYRGNPRIGSQSISAVRPLVSNSKRCCESAKHQSRTQKPNRMENAYSIGDVRPWGEPKIAKTIPKTAPSETIAQITRRFLAINCALIEDESILRIA